MTLAPTCLQPFLDRLLSHSRLSDAEQQVILDLPGRRESVATNRDFVRLGETVSHACVVVDGMVGRFGQTAGGARQITAIHLPGDAPDLHSVVLPSSSSALQALTASTILRIPHADLRAAANRFPALAQAFWRDCVLDAAILSQWVVNVGRRDARMRIAHLLCEMAYRSGGRSGVGEVSFAFPVTQAHLGDATGLTSVHVNRTLRTLKEEGLATLGHGRAHVLDWRRLAKAGDFQPDYLLPGLLSGAEPGTQGRLVERC